MADNDWTDPALWGNREDNSPKGNGYFGVLKRPDGSVSSELSIGVTINGKDVEIPALVPTLSPAEVNHLLSSPANAQMPQPIVQKAVEFAKQRATSGQPYFAQPGEQSNQYSQFARSNVTAPGATFMVPSHGSAGYINDPSYTTTMGQAIRDLIARKLSGS